MENVTRTCLYCGAHYVLTYRESYSEHNGQSSTDVLGKCECGFKKLTDSIPVNCHSCSSHKDGRCFSEHNVKAYLNQIKRMGVDQIDSIKVKPVTNCKYHSFSSDFIESFKFDDEYKRCFLCKHYSRSTKKCFNKQRRSSVVEQAKSYNLPISDLPHIDTKYYSVCENFVLSKVYVEQILKNK